MAPTPKKGDFVKWKWMGGVIEGVVEEVYHRPVSRQIKGKSIKRNGSKEKPAFLVKSKAGNFALKLITEIELSSQKSSRANDSGSFENI